MQIAGPTQFVVTDPQDQNGTALDNTNATASIAIWNEAMTAVIVATTAMTWSTSLATWVYSWTPGAIPAGIYKVLMTLTPTSGIPGLRWEDVTYQPGPTAPATVQPAGVPPVSQHFLEPWCTEADLPDGRIQDSNGRPLADISWGWMISAATDMLFALSGRKYRSGRSIIRPAPIVSVGMRAPAVYPYSAAGAFGGYGSSWGFPTGWAWASLGLGWEGFAGGELHLQAPVRRINQVMVDGVVLNPASDYAMFNRRRLVRANGQAWPANQDVSQPTSAQGTMLIDYEWGRQVNDGGRLACAELSIELGLGFSGQDSCRLPNRVISIATEGVTTQLGSSIDYLKEQLTGLHIVDMFLKATNPSKRRRPPVFLSPDSVLNRRT